MLASDPSSGPAQAVHRPRIGGGTRCGPIRLLLLFVTLQAAAVNTALAQSPETIPTPAPAPPSASGSIRGTVRAQGSGAPIAGATIEFVHQERGGEVVTDARGTYLLRQIPAGRGLLRVRHLGHDPFDVEVIVPAGREIVLDAALAPRPVKLEPVTAEGLADQPLADTLAEVSSELALAGARTIEATPGMAELGITDAVRGIPGNEPPDPGSVLYVRGAAADLKLVFLDGAPVYAPFPLGGLLEPFAPGLLEQADIYLGGSPARYDGGLSYVMDLRTRSGRSTGFSTSGSMDLLSARMLAEGGVEGRFGVVASARGMHPFGSGSLLGDGLPYGYGEGLLRADAAVGRTGVLTVTGFLNEEAVRLGRSGTADSVIRWGNDAGSVRLRGDVRGTRAEMTIATGAYSARLPLTGPQPALATGSASRLRGALDLLSSSGGLQFRYGASIDIQSHRAEAAIAGRAGAPNILEAEGRVAGIYGEITAQPMDRVRIRAGARLDHFSTGTGLAPAPRVAATWLVTDRAAITLAAGRYHQFLRPPDEVLLRSTASRTETVAGLVVGSATHFTAALDQDLGEGLRLGVEGFYKHFSDVPAAHSTEANASGMDFWVRRSSDGVDGWLGYSLAWVWSNGMATGQSDFTGRHLLSAGLLAPLWNQSRLQVRFAYGAGLPYSAIPLETTAGDLMPTNYTVTQALTVSSAERGGTETAPFLRTPDAPFLRLDAEISRQWSPRYGGRTIDIRPYVRVLNSLGRRDALFYLLEPDKGDSIEAVGALPIIPVVGMEWKF